MLFGMFSAPSASKIAPQRHDNDEKQQQRTALCAILIDSLIHFTTLQVTSSKDKYYILTMNGPYYDSSA